MLLFTLGGAVVLVTLLLLAIVFAGPTIVHVPYIWLNKGKVHKKSQCYLDAHFPKMFRVSKVHTAMNAANMDKKLYKVLVQDKQYTTTEFEVPWNNRFHNGGNTPEEVKRLFKMAKKYYLLSQKLYLYFKRNGLPNTSCKVCPNKRLEIITYEKLTNHNRYSIFQKVYQSIDQWKNNTTLTGFHFEIEFTGPSSKGKTDTDSYFIPASWEAISSYKDLNKHLFVRNNKETKRKTYRKAATFLTQQLGKRYILDSNHCYRFLDRENIQQSHFHFFYCTKKHRKHSFCAKEEGMVQCTYHSETREISALKIETDIFNADGTLKILKGNNKKYEVL